MAQGNASYQVDDGTAFAIESSLTKRWKNQTLFAVPILASIKDRDMKYNTGFRIEGTKAIIPVIMTDIAAFNTGTAGVADADQIPTAWPQYDATEGFSQAAYEYTHMRRAMTITESERRLLMGGARGNLLEGKTTQLMEKFNTVKGVQIIGSAAGSRTTIQGVEHVIATANTVGGIDQSTNEVWRGRVTSVGGALGRSHIDTMFDGLSIFPGVSAPDMLSLSYDKASGGVNVFGAVRNFIDDNERYFHKDFQVKYGIVNFDYMGMKCVKENRQTAGTAFMLCTDTFFYSGSDKPTLHHRGPIQGSDAEEFVYTEWVCFGCDEPRRNGRLTGITG